MVVFNLSIKLFSILSLGASENTELGRQEPSTLSNDSSSLVKEAHEVYFSISLMRDNARQLTSTMKTFSHYFNLSKILKL